MNSRKRFPVKRTVYMQTTGRLLPRRISQILRKLNSNFTVWINPYQGNGIDLKVWHGCDLIIAAEVLNWSVKSKLSEKRRENMISNLHEFSCRKLLVYTTLDNNHVSKFVQNGIDVMEIGYQILPRFYYNYYLGKGHVVKREIDCAKTKNNIKKKIVSYLKKHYPHIGIYQE